MTKLSNDDLDTIDEVVTKLEQLDHDNNLIEVTDLLQMANDLLVIEDNHSRRRWWHI